MTKINAFVEKLQKNQTFTQAESHSNFVDIERRMKNLENSSGLTPPNQIPIFRYGNISTITTEGNPMTSPVFLTSVKVIDPSRGLLHNGQIVNAVYEGIPLTYLIPSRCNRNTKSKDRSFEI